MRTPPRLLADAVGHGLVDRGDVLTGRSGVRPVGGSNLVHRVERSGLAVAYVKQAGAASELDGDDCVAVESRVLRRLAPSDLVPTLIDGPSDTAALWTAPVAGVLLSTLADRPLMLDRAAAELGRTLARLHRLAPDTRPAARPWPLLRIAGHELASMTGALADSACAEVLATVDAGPVRELIITAVDHWRTDAWVHGDLAPGNIVAAGGPRIRIRMIDLETAGAGDPGWDLACAVTALDDLDQRAGCPSTVALDEAYVEAGGPGQLSTALWCVRDLVSAWQRAALLHQGGADPGGRLAASVRQLLDRCRARAADPTGSESR